ncbi:MAG: thioredoxin fold domain-containing protein [Granulosicoccus sp.]
MRAIVIKTMNIRRWSALWLIPGLLVGMIQLVSAAEPGNIVGIEDFEIPDWFKSSFLEIAEDAGEAGEQDKHVLLFFHLNNCPYCSKTLAENFDAGENSEFIQANFDSIDINIKGDLEVVFNEEITLSEKELANALKVNYTPTIIFINGDNEPVLRIDGYRDSKRFRTALEFVESRAYQEKSLAEYAEATTTGSYTFRDHPAFTELTDLHKAAENPLAVVFEDQYCGNCDEVHDTLFAREGVRKALSELTVVRLDALSTERIIDPAGNETTPKQMAADLQLTYSPAIVLYDRGEQKARIDSHLYSWYFNGFVKWVAGRHYEAHPEPYSYIKSLREARLAAGGDVSYID